jgi:hypothetical protein
LPFEAAQQKRNTCAVIESFSERWRTKTLMADFRRVHSIHARHSPRAIRNKGSALRSSADENGCLLPELIEQWSHDFAEANTGCVECQDVARRGE